MAPGTYLAPCRTFKMELFVKAVSILSAGNYFRKKSHLIYDSPAGIYMLKVNNRNTRTRCEICLNLTIKIPERHHVPVSLLLTLNIFHILF